MHMGIILSWLFDESDFLDVIGKWCESNTGLMENAVKIYEGLDAFSFFFPWLSHGKNFTRKVSYIPGFQILDQIPRPRLLILSTTLDRFSQSIQFRVLVF